jgi:hypothetical protein
MALRCWVSRPSTANGDQHADTGLWSSGPQAGEHRVLGGCDGRCHVLIVNPDAQQRKRLPRWPFLPTCGG